jgi:hypothetical protein
LLAPHCPSATPEQPDRFRKQHGAPAGARTVAACDVPACRSNA